MTMLTNFARWVLVRLLRRLVLKRFGRKQWSACTFIERQTVAIELTSEIARELREACGESRASR